MPFTYEELFAKFSELGITTATIEHPPLRTVEEARQLSTRLDGGQVKNLFLKDAKKHYWLLVTLEDTKINLKQTSIRLGIPKLSFASAEDLFAILGILPGAVSPLSLINDVKKLVTVVLEDRLVKTTPLNFHPLRNDRTTNIASSDFLKFLETTGHVPLIVDFDDGESSNE